MCGLDGVACNYLVMKCQSIGVWAERMKNKEICLYMCVSVGVFICTHIYSCTYTYVLMLLCICV